MKVFGVLFILALLAGAFSVFGWPALALGGFAVLFFVAVATLQIQADILGKIDRLVTVQEHLRGHLARLEARAIQAERQQELLVRAAQRQLQHVSDQERGVPR
jgi:hypothetical protein